MAMLGALHKLNLGLAPKQMQELFPLVGSRVEPLWKHRLRWWRPLRNKQLQTPATYRSSDVMKRSVFGLANLYNALPQFVVEKTSVKAFQKTLQNALSERAALRSGRRCTRVAGGGFREQSLTGSSSAGFLSFVRSLYIRMFSYSYFLV